VPYAHIVTATTHQALGGLILADDRAIAAKLNSSVVDVLRCQL
jgi:glycine/serine hydroxymethyltransferase